MYMRAAVYQIDFFSHRLRFFFRPRAFSRALARGAHRGEACPRLHHGTMVGPGRPPWRVIWVFDVTKYGK